MSEEQKVDREKMAEALKAAEFGGQSLKGADLRGLDLAGAYLPGADMRSADLRRANLRKADLSGADLESADMRGADLTEADLRGADLGLCNLKNAVLDGAMFTEASFFWARNAIRLPVADPRGHDVLAVQHASSWMIAAGHRWFTLSEARSHWGTGYEGSRKIGDQYLFGLDWLEAQE